MAKLSYTTISGTLVKHFCQPSELLSIALLRHLGVAAARSGMCAGEEIAKGKQEKNYRCNFVTRSFLRPQRNAAS